MKRLLILAIALLALLLTSCLDPEPSEISVIVTKGGKPHQAGVQLFSGGKQIQEVYTQGQAANVYIKQIAPGRYTLRFIDSESKAFPAVREVTVGAGDSEVIEVDLDDTSQNPPNA